MRTSSTTRQPLRLIAISKEIGVIAAVALLSLGSSYAAIQVVDTQVAVPSPVGIAYNPLSDSLVVSVNQQSEGLPNNFVSISDNRQISQFTGASGLTSEVKIEIARVTAAGFSVGELFCGSGTPGEIVKITPDGTVINPWAVLIDNNLQKDEGMVRGLRIDQNTGTSPFAGFLIATTTKGGVYRITPAGTATWLATIKRADGTMVHLEGTTTIPTTSPLVPWQGRIIAGAEGTERIPEFTPLFYEIMEQNGVVTVTSRSIPQPETPGKYIAPEDLDIIPANENLYVVNNTSGTLLTAKASSFSTRVGQVLVTQEGAEAGYSQELYAIRYAGGTLVADHLYEHQETAAFEHATFAPDDPIVVTVEAEPSVVQEDVPSGSAITFVRQGDLNDTAYDLTVAFARSGAAVKGTDYSLSPDATSIQISATALSAEMTLTPIDDILAEGNEPALFTITSSPAYTIGTPGSVTVTIADNDGSAPNVVTIRATDPVAGERPGIPTPDTGQFAISRFGNLSGTLLVNLATEGTATLNADYERDPAGSSVTFAEFENEKVITVTPLDDALVELVETAVLRLAPGSGYTTTPPDDVATVWLYDRPVVNVRTIMAEAAEVPTENGAFEFTRTGSLDLALDAVAFTVATGAPDDATYGDDYLFEPAASVSEPPAPLAMRFEAGESVVYLTVSPLQDSRNEGTENVTMALTTTPAPATYTVGTSATGLVTITDDPADDVPQPTYYNVQEITPGTGDYYQNWSEAYAVNSFGSVVGMFNPPPNVSQWTPHAFRWDLSVGISDLHPAGPSAWSYAYGINDAGIIVGSYQPQSPGGDFAFRWDAVNGMVLLDPVLFGSLGNYAVAINSEGVPVGYGPNAQGVTQVIWWNGTTAIRMKSLSIPDEDFKTSYAYAISDGPNGPEMVGKSRGDFSSSAFHAFRVPLTAPQLGPDYDLGTGTGVETDASEATGINDLDEVVGASNFNTAGGKRYHAFYKTAYQGQYLGFADLTPLKYWSRAVGISNQGHVAGAYKETSVSPQRAFVVWNSGAFIDLWDYANQSQRIGWDFTYPKAVGDNGWIVGWGYKNGKTRAFILTPVF